MIPLPPPTTRSILAYIDAGTATLILQILVSCLIGGLFLLRTFWGKVKTFSKSLFSRSKRK